MDFASLAVFGAVDLRAPTLDRLPLRLHVAQPVAEETPQVPLWRRPAVVVAVVLSFLAVIGALVLTLLL